MTEDHKGKFLKFTAKTALGFALRMAIIGPILYMLAGYDDKGVSAFVIILIVAHTVMLLLCTTLIPAEYAIKTDIAVLEFNMWKPQAIAIYAFGLICCGTSYFLVAADMYWYAGILFTYGLGNVAWPRYVSKIDMASKLSMIDKLSGDPA